MTSLDDRRDSFERKFAHDEELRFKAIARRNKLLGLWAAEKLGKSGADADAYARSVVLADVQAAGDADVLRRVTADLASAGLGKRTSGPPWTGCSPSPRPRSRPADRDRLEDRRTRCRRPSKVSRPA